MKNINLLFFSLGKHDVAGNKRLRNLAKYLGKNHSVQTTIVKPFWDYTNLDSLQGIFYYLLKSVCLLINLFQFPIVLFKGKREKAKNILYFYEAEHVFFHRLLLAKLFGYQIILDLVENPASLPHNSSFFKKIRVSYFMLIYKLLPFFFSGVFVVSVFLKSKIARDFKGKVNVFLLPVSYDADDFSGLSKYYEYPTAFYGGSYGDNYDFLSFFKVLEKVFERHPKLKLFLSGKIPIEIFDLIKNQTGLTKNIVFMGFLSEEEYYRTISGTDILCMPRNNSLHANAGFPFKLAEYLATGNPVITSRVSDVGDYLTDNDAFIYDPENIEEFKDKFFEILADMPKAKLKGMNGKKIAERNFSANNQAKDVFEFLKSV